MKCSKCNKEISKNDFIITNGEYICLDCISNQQENTNSQENNTIYQDGYLSNIPATPVFNQLDIFNEDSSKPTLEKPNDKISANGIEKRISIWKEKLIDLSKRNRLLNFKQTKGSTLKIIDEIPPEIFKSLYCKNTQMRLH